MSFRVPAFPHLKSLPKAIRFLTKKAYPAELGFSGKRVRAITVAPIPTETVRGFRLQREALEGKGEFDPGCSSGQASPTGPELFDETLDLPVESDHVQLRVLRAQFSFDFCRHLGTREDALIGSAFPHE